MPDASFPACGPQRAYFQRPGATYQAYRHNNLQSPAEIGIYGTTTTIDASQAPYNGTVTFSGVYHLRGNVRFINGNFVLPASTVFYIDGQSGVAAKPQTTVEVEGATLRLTNATLQANCPDKWAGIRLTLFGKLYTGGSGQRQRLRSRIADANVGVWTSETNEYYLTHTDFINNNIGVYDYNYQKSAAQPGEGVSNCLFSDNSGTGTGIWFEPMDSFNGTFAGDYTAASFTLNTFTNLRYGIYGFASNAPIDNNAFTSNWMAGIATYYSGGSPMRVRNNTFTLPATLPAGQSHTTTYGLDVNNGWQLENNTFRCLTAVGSTPTLIQVGAALVGAPPMSGNLFRDLDLGLDLRTDAGGSYAITANTFFNNAEGLRFSTNQPNTPTPSVTLRCNTFTSNVTGAIGVWVRPSTRFPGQLGSASLPNGNNFSGIADNKKRFVYEAGNSNFQYFRYNSTQEEFSTTTPTNAGNVIYNYGGNAVTTFAFNTGQSGSGACGLSSSTPGVYARAAGQSSGTPTVASDVIGNLSVPYPNPASEVVTFAYALPANGVAGRVVVRNVLGNITTTTETLSGTNEASLLVRNLPAGFYTATLEVQGRNVATQKLAIQH